MKKRLELHLKGRNEWRQWLSNNHDTVPICLLMLKSLPGGGENITYLDAVEEALCFGWIDSTRKRIDSKTISLQFTPRRPDSNWTELNKERARRLIHLELMTEAGRMTLPDLSEEAFLVDEEILRLLKKDETTYENYRNFPPLYVRVKIGNIQGVRSDRGLYLKRLHKFLDATAAGRLFGEWNDQGRLIDYK